MLKIETNELDKITEFLGLLNTDLNSLDYIEKDDFFYNVKTNEAINHFLTYLLINYQNFTDLHFTFDPRQKIINVRVRQLGQMYKTSITLSASDNYEIAKINNHSFSTYMFKEILEVIQLNSSMENGKDYDFKHDLNIPMFGEYRLRSAVCGHDGITRLLKLHEENNMDTINCNIMKIDRNPIYTIEVEVKEGFLIHDGKLQLKESVLIHNSKVQFTPEIQSKIDLYEEKLDKMFKTFKGNVNIYKYKKMKIVLEYEGNNVINVTIPNTYSIGRVEMDKVILNYVLKNYSDFYDPIFTSFIEDVTQIKFDSIIGEFKTPEAFKDYLTTIGMLKI
jgi:hypothetical protein